MCVHKVHIKTESTQYTRCTSKQNHTHIDLHDLIHAADVHVKPSQRKEMLTELRSAAGHAAVMRELHAIADAAGAGEGDEDADAGPIVAQQHHIETVDKAAPAIEPGMHVGQVCKLQQTTRWPSCIDWHCTCVCSIYCTKRDSHLSTLTCLLMCVMILCPLQTSY